MNKGVLGIESRRGYGLDNSKILFNRISPREATSSTTYVDLGTVGPIVIIREAGTYVVEFGAWQRNTSASTGVSALTSLAVNGTTAASDGEAFRLDNDNAGGNSGKGVWQKTLVPGDVLTLKHRSSNGVSCQFEKRWLRATKIA